MSIDRVKKKKSCDITINIANTKYSIIKKVARFLGWKTTEDSDLKDKSNIWDVVWLDGGLGTEKILQGMQPFQRINHFPGMHNIYRKDRLAKLMSHMRSLFMREYSFTPHTWTLPDDHIAVCSYLRGKKKRCVILKPSTGAQGRGIFLATTPQNIVRSYESYVVQSYISNPLLIEGLKFDLRIYVLVLSCNPLRVLLYREGLCRFCTEKYEEPNECNLRNTFMHLTNYSINKHNEHFVQNNGEDRGLYSSDVHSSDENSFNIHESSNSSSVSKRSISWLRSWLRSSGQDDELMWKQISHIVVKTLLAVQPFLNRARESYHPKDCFKDQESLCFELLGFDVILDENLRPHLLEVNHSPSFSTDSKLDFQVKSSLLADTFLLLKLSARRRDEYFAEKAKKAQMRLYGDLFNETERSKGHNKDKSKNLADSISNISNFDEVYPSNIPELQEIYDNIMSAWLSDEQPIQGSDNSDDIHLQRFVSAKVTTVETSSTEPLLNIKFFDPKLGYTATPPPSFLRPSVSSLSSPLSMSRRTKGVGASTSIPNKTIQTFSLYANQDHSAADTQSTAIVFPYNDSLAMNKNSVILQTTNSSSQFDKSMQEFDPSAEFNPNYKDEVLNFRHRDYSSASKSPSPQSLSDFHCNYKLEDSSFVERVAAAQSSAAVEEEIRMAFQRNYFAYRDLYLVQLDQRSPVEQVSTQESRITIMQNYAYLS